MVGIWPNDDDALMMSQESATQPSTLLRVVAKGASSAAGVPFDNGNDIRGHEGAVMEGTLRRVSSSPFRKKVTITCPEVDEQRIRVASQ